MAAFFMALFFVRLQTYIKKNINRKPAKIPLAGYLRRVGLGIPRQNLFDGENAPGAAPNSPPNTVWRGNSRPINPKIPSRSARSDETFNLSDV